MRVHTADEAPCRGSWLTRAIKAARFKPSFTWLLPFGFLTLIIGMLAGLRRMGWIAPAPAGIVLAHGLVMTSGFLGLLIGAERAAALGKTWAWSVPLLGLAGSLAWVAWPVSGWGWQLYTAEAFMFTVIAIRFLFIQNTPAMKIMLMGALCWLAGNIVWHYQGASPAVILMWAGFPLWTVAGERVELSGGARVTTFGWWALAFAGMAYVLGMAGYTSAAGVSLVVLGVWLVRYDVARLHLKHKGERRFLAWCLLGGYAWLAAGGVVLLAMSAGIEGYLRDAWIHCIFLGFLFSMIFGHVTLVLPALTGLTLAWHPSFYVHLLLLHVSLMGRVGGAVIGNEHFYQRGSLLNAAALMIFLLNNVLAIRRGKKQERVK